MELSSWEEYDTDSFMTVVNGIEAWITKEASSNHARRAWRWSVQVSSSRCEWPELVSCGNSPTKEAAIKKCESWVGHADKRYPTISYV